MELLCLSRYLLVLVLVYTINFSVSGTLVDHDEEVTTECVSTGSLCIQSCMGMINMRNYQSCRSCQEYIACINGTGYLTPCGPGLYYDYYENRCGLNSSTCVHCKAPRNSTRARNTSPPFATKRTSTPETQTPEAIDSTSPSPSTMSTSSTSSRGIVTKGPAQQTPSSSLSTTPAVTSEDGEASPVTIAGPSTSKISSTARPRGTSTKPSNDLLPGGNKTTTFKPTPTPKQPKIITTDDDGHQTKSRNASNENWSTLPEKSVTREPVDVEDILTSKTSKADSTTSSLKPAYTDYTLAKETVTPPPPEQTTKPNKSYSSLPAATGNKMEATVTSGSGKHTPPEEISQNSQVPTTASNGVNMDRIGSTEDSKGWTDINEIKLYTSGPQEEKRYTADLIPDRLSTTVQTVAETTSKLNVVLTQSSTVKASLTNQLNGGKDGTTSTNIVSVLSTQRQRQYTTQTLKTSDNSKDSIEESGDLSGSGTLSTVDYLTFPVGTDEDTNTEGHVSVTSTIRKTTLGSRDLNKSTTVSPFPATSSTSRTSIYNNRTTSSTSTIGPADGLKAAGRIEAWRGFVRFMWVYLIS